MTKRYSLEQKREILEYAEANTIREACIKFSVSKFSINLWKGHPRKNRKMANALWYATHGKEYSSRPYVKERRRQSAAKRRLNPQVREKDKATNKEYRWKRAFVLLAYYANRAEKRRGEKDYFKLKALDIWTIAKRQKLKCAITGLKLHRHSISLDHIIPRSLGGSNAPDNLQLLHRWANIAKHDQSQDDFLDFCNIIALKHPRQPNVKTLEAKSFLTKNQYTGFAARSKTSE